MLLAKSAASGVQIDLWRHGWLKIADGHVMVITANLLAGNVRRLDMHKSMNLFGDTGLCIRKTLSIVTSLLEASISAMITVLRSSSRLLNSCSQSLQGS